MSTSAIALLDSAPANLTKLRDDDDLLPPFPSMGDPVFEAKDLQAANELTRHWEEFREYLSVGDDDRQEVWDLWIDIGGES